MVVNPIAGMGGRVGLKGTDNMVEKARQLGAEPRAPERAREALQALDKHAQSDLTLLTAGGVMGEDEARTVGFTQKVVYRPGDPAETTAQDTQSAVEEFISRDVDLVLFVGGDGTACDIAETVLAAEAEIPILGVPAGVKIYSSVFAVSPADAGRIAATYDCLTQREVNDIDEEAYRDGELRSELKAIVSVPASPAVQSSKQLGGGTVESLAAGFAEEIIPGTTYVLGPGSTVGAIKRELGFEGSPLGVDVWRAHDDADEAEASPGELLVRDGSESEILAAMAPPTVIVVSPIGGQGFVFGRGNQQLSPDVIRKGEICVVGSSEKLDALDELRVDTGEPELDAALRGWQKVRVGRFEHRLRKIV